MSPPAAWKTCPPPGARGGRTRPSICGSCQRRNRNMQAIELSRLETPIGPLLLAVSGLAGGKLVALEFGDDQAAARANLERTHPGVPVEPSRGGAIVDRVKAYFAGDI